MPVKLIVVLISFLFFLLGLIGILSGQSILITIGFGSGTAMLAIGQNT